MKIDIGDIGGRPGQTVPSRLARQAGPHPLAAAGMRGNRQ